MTDEISTVQWNQIRDELKGEFVVVSRPMHSKIFYYNGKLLDIDSTYIWIHDLKIQGKIPIPKAGGSSIRKMTKTDMLILANKFNTLADRLKLEALDEKILKNLNDAVTKLKEALQD